MNLQWLCAAVEYRAPNDNVDIRYTEIFMVDAKNCITDNGKSLYIIIRKLADLIFIREIQINSVLSAWSPRRN